MVRRKEGLVLADITVKAEWLVSWDASFVMFNEPFSYLRLKEYCLTAVTDEGVVG